MSGNSGSGTDSKRPAVELNRGIYCVKGKGLACLPFLSSNAFILNTSPERGILLIDSCGSGSGRLIADAMEGVGLDPGRLSGIAITHWHNDHTGSLAEIVSIAASRGAGEICIFMHREDCRIFLGGRGRFIKFHPLLRFPLYHVPGRMPEDGRFRFVEFEGQGGNPLEPWGIDFVHVPGHTPGNSAFYHGESGSLFCGSGMAMIDDETAGIMPVFCDRKQQVESARKLMNMDFKYLYPAHINVRSDAIPPDKRIPVTGHVPFMNRLKGTVPLFRYGS